MDAPIWRDERTGLPMHRHFAAKTSVNGTVVYWVQDPSSCGCGHREFDMPLSTEQERAKEVKD